MCDLITLILAIYVVGSILRREANRKREVQRIQSRIGELSSIVHQMQDQQALRSEQFIQLEIRDLQMQLEHQLMADRSDFQETFQHLHYVEEQINKSVFLPADLPISAESTLS